MRSSARGDREVAFHPMMGKAPLSTCPLSCLEQAPGKRGSTPELTELVYILGHSFLAVCSFPLHLPPFHFPPFHLLPPSTLGWGHHGGSMKTKQAAAMLASPFQPCGSPQMRRSGATALETSQPSLRSGGGENTLHTSRKEGSSRDGDCRHPRVAHKCGALLASPLLPQANGFCI